LVLTRGRRSLDELDKRSFNFGMGSSAMKVQIDPERCQGHGRCYDLVPDLFGDDDEGFGMVLGDGAVQAGKEREARLAVANCPERAIDLIEES
jgi:ferredoxin